MCRCDGSNLLIDCGEGTQIAMKERDGVPSLSMSFVLPTHHADHISGLPRLLLTLGNAGRVEPVKLISPRDLSEWSED